MRESGRRRIGQVFEPTSPPRPIMLNISGRTPKYNIRPFSPWRHAPSGLLRDRAERILDGAVGAAYVVTGSLHARRITGALVGVGVGATVVYAVLRRRRS